MPKVTQKRSFLEISLLKACFEIISSSKLREVDKHFEEALFDFVTLSTYRYCSPRRLSVPKSQDWVLNVLPKYDDNRFKSCLRVTRNQFAFVLENIKRTPVFRSMTSSKMYPIETQLAVALYRFGNDGSGTSYVRVAEHFGISEAGMVQNCTDRVIQALLSLESQYIKWPDQDERKAICEKMEDKLPRCVGYLDGSHIPVYEAPIDDHEAYFSRKQVYGIQIQAVCDNDLVFPSLSVGYPASAHDARVFLNSPLGQHTNRFLSKDEWIAADSAYKLTRHVVTPFRDNATSGTAALRRKFNRHFSDSNFVLGNAQVTAHPIVYCSDGFCELTGYPRAQIMQKGCACKFLYGPDTTDDQKAQIEKSLEFKSELKMEVILYKKNNTPFWCLLDIVPIKNEKAEVVLFLASHKDITHTKTVEFCDNMYDSDANGNVDPEAPPANYGRRRSRAVLYQLSGHYTKDNRRKSKLKLNNTLLQPTEAPLPEYKTAAIEKSRFVLTHYGIFKTCWDWLILVATIYVAIMVPYNAAFRKQERSDSPPPVRDVVVEMLFIIDIGLHFRTTFVNRKGEVVSNPKVIALHYVKGWFILDLLAALPFDLFQTATIMPSLDNEESLIHLLKLTRLLRLARLLQKMDRYSQFSAAILSLLMLCFTLAAHWLACIWYFIADRERVTNSWLTGLAEKLDTNITLVSNADKYATALYFTCSSLTSVGFGNVAANTFPEKIFSILMMLVGALMHAMVFGNVTAIVQRMYARRSQYQSKFRDLKDFLKLHQIPKDLKQRVEDYFQTMWALNHGIDPHETLKEFPEELRGDVSMHLHKEILSLPIFEPACHGCLKLLSLHIRTAFCAPGEYLVHKGDALHYIYYLSNGSMEVVQCNMVVAILGKGDLVGSDISQQMTAGCDVVIKSRCDVRALTYCDLKSIYIPGLVEVLRLYPEFQIEFQNDIQHDLTYNLREGYEAESTESENGHGAQPSLTLPSISEDDEVDEDDDGQRLLTARSEDSRSFSSKSPLLSRDNGTSKRSLSECGDGSTMEIQAELMTLAQEMRSLVKNLEKNTRSTGTQTENVSSSAWASSPSII